MCALCNAQYPCLPPRDVLSGLYQIWCGVCAAPPITGAGSSPGQAGDVDADGAAAARADGHRHLARGLAADRRQLGELVVAQKRAAAAAELADAK